MEYLFVESARSKKRCKPSIRLGKTSQLNKNNENSRKKVSLYSATFNGLSRIRGMMLIDNVFIRVSTCDKLNDLKSLVPKDVKVFGFQ